jgi:hypothetical protein
MSLTPDQRCDHLAGRQHGLLTRQQALGCGLTERQIDWRLRCGRWIPVIPGVYRVARSPSSWQQRALAACLAGPLGTVCSHGTAAALHGLGMPAQTPQIIVRRTASPRIPFAKVRWADLGPRDRLVVDGIPCTGVARTLLDCAGVLHDVRLSALVDTAFCAGKSHPTDVVRAIERAQAGRGKKGVARLRVAIEAWTPGIAPGSPAEMRLLRQIRSWGFDEPEFQLELRTADGEPHNPRCWARDEARHPRYTALGWDVHRVDKHDLVPGAARPRELLNAYLVRPGSLNSSEEVAS